MTTEKRIIDSSQAEQKGIVHDVAVAVIATGTVDAAKAGVSKVVGKPKEQPKDK